MMKINSNIRRTWELLIETRQTPIAFALNATLDSFPDIGYGGHVEVIAQFYDPNQSPPEKSWRCQVVVMQRIGSTSGKEPILAAIQFALPDCLRQAGIGTHIWSQIYRVLIAEWNTPIWLRGTLSAVDATTKTVDPTGRFEFQQPQIPFVGQQVIERSNIERRNSFWQRMLSERDRVFDCNEAGNGNFLGRFVDPALHPSYRPVFTVRELG